MSGVSCVNTELNCLLNKYVNASEHNCDPLFRGDTPWLSGRWLRIYLQNGFWSPSSKPRVKTPLTYCQCALFISFWVAFWYSTNLSQPTLLLLALEYSRPFFLDIRRSLEFIHGRWYLLPIFLDGTAWWDAAKLHDMPEGDTRELR